VALGGDDQDQRPPIAFNTVISLAARVALYRNPLAPLSLGHESVARVHE